MKIKVLLFVVCLSAFACAPKQDVKATSDNPKEVIGVINKDSTASPVITFIGKTNAPKTILAGKPEVHLNTNSDGLGASNFTNYNTEQGLALSSIDCGYRDKKGNLWFGTDGGGVSRYDGKSFTNFTTAQGLTNNVVYGITEDKTGNLWFATDGGGVSRYDGKSFTNFTMTHGLPKNTVWSITADKTGNLWFGTGGGGVSRFDGKSFTNFTRAQGLINNSVWSIIEDKIGNLWFAADSGGVSRYDGKSFTNFAAAQGLLANNGVRSIIQDKTGNLWFGTSGGGGVSRYDGKSFTNFTTAQGLANNSVWSIIEDKTKNLWFATSGGGVSRYDGKSFTNFTTAQGLASKYVWNITEDKTGNLWMGTTGGGVSRYDGKSFTNFTTEQGLANNTVLSITEDKKGNLWFGTDGGGVSRYDGKSFTNFTTAQGLGNNRIWSILEDKKGNIWFATNGGGVSCYDGNSFTNFTTVQGLAKNDVWNITEDKMGNLWFGTFGGGVSRYDGKSFINFTSAQGLADDVVYDIVIDLQENIFIGTNLGFSVLKGFKSLTPISASHEEIIPAVNSLVNEELKNHQPVFEFYNKKTGYPVKDLGINAMFMDSKGIIWGGCGDKVIRFDYKAILKNTEPPAVFIQAVKIQNENISWNNLIKKRKTNPEFDSLVILNDEVFTFGRKLSDLERDSMRRKFSGIKFDSITRFYPLPENLMLPYNHNSVTFDFVAIEPARNFLVRYQYILEGYDRDWSPVTDKTSATFGNIDEGVYTFKLKASSSDGVWSEPVTYTFKVLPPWYRTWWAYMLYAILFIGSIWSFIHYRSRSLRREKRLLEEKVTQRTNQLSRSLQELKETQAQLIQSEKMASLGELTAGIAHEIQNPLNFVNNFSEVNRELIEDMEQEIDKGNFKEVKTIANDIKENEQKINHHGKRADAIVKGMLQHSRASTSQKELTDINKLTDEYLRLSYQGLRAKDQSFNATIQTDFDERIGKINIISQDIGRVLLNLFTNAFYSVTEKKKKFQQDPTGFKNLLGMSDYEPAVVVSTKKENDKVIIKVNDNGNGIPQKVLDKIFQPFFTTKPTGQGTGLGLSMSYDIVKAHGGELKVNTTEGLSLIHI